MKLDVQKNITINAPLATVRELVEDFNNWNFWSPWTVLEPECTVTVTGTPKEVGHSMSWDGEVIGAGQNTLASFSDNQINYDLEFLKPFKSKAKVSFTFEELGEKTQVTWTMDSSMPFFLFFMIKMMKNMIGMDYDRGLKMLKTVAETGKVNCDTINNDIVDYQGFSYIGLQRTVSFDDMPNTMQKDFEKIVNDIIVEGGQGATHWVCLYPKFDMKKMEATYIAAVSDEDVGELNLGAEYVRGKIDNSPAFEVKHNGSYEFLGNAWAMAMMNVRAKKLKGGGFPFEQYWNSPMETAPDDLKTSIYIPLKK